MKLLSITGLGFSYSSKRVIEDLTFDLDAGEIVALIAPSGAGKSTLFRLIAGLHPVSEGDIRFRDQAPGGLPRRLFLGFQDFDAFPWLTVDENICLALEYRSIEGNELSADVVARRVGLEHEHSRYPSELSGGMRKRLAFARFLASGATLVLLDEPFSSLDTHSRLEMQQLAIRVVRESGCAMIIATHDVQEAVFLADRVLVCSGPPLQVVHSVTGSRATQRDAAYMESDEYQRRSRELMHSMSSLFTDSLGS